MAASFQYRFGFLCAACSVLLVSAAQLLLKAAMMQAHDLPGVIAAAIHLNPSSLPLLAGGLLCYGLSFIVWQRALSDLPLSLAYPLLSLSYPLVYVATLFLPSFGDKLSAQRVAGILLILIGAALLAPINHAIDSDATTVDSDATKNKAAKNNAIKNNATSKAR